MIVMFFSLLTQFLGAAEINRFLKLLNPVSEANWQEDRGCMEGTRTEILNTIIAWVNRPLDMDQPRRSHSDSVYWLYGMPASGKTTVAHSLCHRLYKSEQLGGSFFCKEDDVVLREPKNVLPTLMSRLALTWPPYGELVAQVLQGNPYINPKSTSGKLLSKSLRALERQPSRTFVLVIDAFDECGDDTTRINILNSLFEATFHTDWLKVIITSRFEQGIQSFFETHACTKQYLAEDEQNYKDIFHFAQKRMQQLAEKRHFPPEWPGEARLDQITRRSHGIFLYVDTICDILKPFKNLDQKLDLLLGEQQQAANSNLYPLYLRALTSQVGEETKEFGLVARAIVATSIYRPLSDEALASMIGKDLSVVQSWVDALNWVFIRDQSLGGGIRIRHTVVLEFLTGLRDPVELRVDLKLAHEELSLYCLRTMTRELTFNICRLETSYLANREIKNLDDRVQRNISETLQYACTHWTNHLCADLDPPSEEVGTLLDRFLTEGWSLYWLEVSSVMENVPAAITALETITKSNKVCTSLRWRWVD